MIVFLDIEKKKIQIYTESGIQSIPFSSANSIKQILGTEKILYVTGAVEAAPEDIIDVVKAVLGNIPDASVEDEEPAFLRTTIKGIMTIEEVGLILKGPIHFYPLTQLYSEHGTDVFEQHKILGHMLKTGKLQIITASQANDIKKVYLESKKKEQAKIDASLDSILVNGKVDDYLDNIGDDDGPGAHADAIHINVSSGPMNSSSNEGSLLPDDFEG